MTRNHSARTLLAASALLVTVFSTAAFAEKGERGNQEEVISAEVEVNTHAAQIATDVVLTEHPGVEQVEPGRSIDDDTRLNPAEQGGK